MHELPVTESLLNISLKHAQKANATQIKDIYIVIGQLASIIDDSVEFYWDIISKGTIAEDAKLHFKRIPTEFLCLDCNHKYNPSDSEFLCPKCNSAHIKIIKGREFYIEAIDIETEEIVRDQNK